MAILAPLPFTEKLVASSSRNLEQSLIRIEAGSIQERIVKGVNSRYDTIQIEWSGLTLSEYIQLIQFWDAHGKTASWAYAEIGQESKAFIFMDSLSVSNTGCDSYNVSTTAMQVYDTVQGIAFPTPTPTSTRAPTPTGTPSSTPAPMLS